VEVVTFRTEGLGDSTHLLMHDGFAVLVDPQRDIDRFLDRLDGAELRWVLETHLHNDYVSGGLTAARRTGAELVMPAGAAPVFTHTPAFHREDLTHGDLVVRPLHTPGHTPEHVSYAVVLEDEVRAVFSGGSLLVGSAGRSDLLGDERALTLARLQYGSVTRLASLPETAGLYPTHGSGSFCSVTEAGADTSTIGEEKRTNPVLAHPDRDSFVASHLGGLQPYPTYYARMAPINLAGPEPLPDLATPRVEATAIDPAATVVDIRPVEVFAGAHLPGSLNLPLNDEFGTWFGWLVPPGTATVLVAERDEDVIEARTQLARIGVDTVAGAVVDPGGAATATSPLADISTVPSDAQILDVRSPAERGDRDDTTVHGYLPSLVEGPPPGIDPSLPVWVVCASGYRAAMGASLLGRQGLDAVAVVGGGMDDL
jgi:hydroxyacylglutathione hydrolase